MARKDRVSVYDRIKQEVTAQELIARLGMVPVRQDGAEAYFNPLCHESSSGTSLQINMHTGRWNCKACQDFGYYGDLIQFTEYVLTNGAIPSHGKEQATSPAHREAVEWICNQFAIPFEEDQYRRDDALSVVHLFAMEAHNYLINNEKALAWVQEQWGFDRSTVEAYGIGYMPSPILPSIAAEANRAESRNAFKSSGVGFYRDGKKFETRFAGRVTFPYLEHGRAVYLIGRSTPSTPSLDNGQEPPKYFKLTVHSSTRPHISPSITNDHLYNETILSTADEIGVLEGITDTISVSSLGFPVVSPVTVSFNANDLKRFVAKCHENGIRRVWILFDNELSGSGNHGAFKFAAQLIENGIDAKILTLPLPEAQQVAYDEVKKSMPAEAFYELERADPRRRKLIIKEQFPDDAKREWITSQIKASKIDAAEWVAMQGAGAASRFNQILKDGRFFIDIKIEECAESMDPEGLPYDRTIAFSECYELIAHLEDAPTRESYAGKIAKLAGPGIYKSHIKQKISDHRRQHVLPKRKDEKESRRQEEEAPMEPLVLPPPQPGAVQPSAPSAPGAPKAKEGDRPSAPAAPGAPGQVQPGGDEYESLAKTRLAIAQRVEKKESEESIGKFVATIITKTLGYTPFNTESGIYLVRSNECCLVGDRSLTRQFTSILLGCSGLSNRKTTHRLYIDFVLFWLERFATEVRDVSWSHVTQDRTVYLPTGDTSGSLIHIKSGEIERTTMAETKVPCVTGETFLPFQYTKESTGVTEIIDLFRWCSLSESGRMILIYWVVTLPLLRRIGTVPIVRVEGGSGSGKTRTVDAISILVNGQKSSAVPTAAALTSSLSREMLTVDDNREADDITKAFLSTLLQASNLGAKEKRKANTDTETITERVCGALLMNGIEPIHSGKPELASRMLVFNASKKNRAKDSPTSDQVFREAILKLRDRFWSEACDRCAMALEFEETYGETMGIQIEERFEKTRIGRLSAYLRVMYFTWVAGLPEDERIEALRNLDTRWSETFESMDTDIIATLSTEEVATQAIAYLFRWAEMNAEKVQGSSKITAQLFTSYGVPLYVKYSNGKEELKEMRATEMVKYVRLAAKNLNGPPELASFLKSGQLEARLIDGRSYIESAGFGMETRTTGKQGNRFRFFKVLDLEQAAIEKQAPAVRETKIPPTPPTAITQEALPNAEPQGIDKKPTAPPPPGAPAPQQKAKPAAPPESPPSSGPKPAAPPGNGPPDTWNGPGLDGDDMF